MRGRHADVEGRLLLLLLLRLLLLRRRRRRRPVLWAGWRSLRLLLCPLRDDKIVIVLMLKL